MMRSNPARKRTPRIDGRRQSKRWEALVAFFVCSSSIFFVNVGASCSSALFECLDAPGDCIPKTWMCDGSPDCSDGSDESDVFCSLGDKKACNETLAYQCPGGACIPSRWLCDGEKDCKNGEDEKKSLCPEVACKPGHFVCNNSSVCIPPKFVCDESPDCPDGSDEANCPRRNCSAAEFRCGDGRCVNVGWVCDGTTDCEDGLDEKNCAKPTCHPMEEFMCGNGRCVPVGWRCDGDADCVDSSDELNCPKKNITGVVCGSTEWQCDSGKECVHNSWVCDGDPDCADESDESPATCPVGSNSTSSSSSSETHLALQQHTQDEAPVVIGSSCRADQFHCGDGHCIPVHLRCDGAVECADGSDEKDCGAGKKGKVTCNAGSEFACISGQHCIPLERVCDGTADCQDGSDEPKDKCNVDECAIHNGGCQHECENTATGFKCKCPIGFELVNATHCRDIDECQQWGLCSQTCVNFPGTYKCECLPGYTKEVTNPHKCRIADGGNPSLVFANVADIRRMDLSADGSRRGDGMELLAAHTRYATAVDFDLAANRIFWSDTNDHRIYSAEMNDPEKRTAIVAEEGMRSDGLAVDWIHQLLYFTCAATRSSVDVARVDGTQRKTLVSGDPGSKLRALAIDPSEGWLFFSDWGQKPKIERAGMDGTHRSVVVRGAGVEWPNGLTIDHVAMRLYWVDAKLHQISSVKFDGSDRRLVLHSHEHLGQPFSLAVFQDWIYWSDWEQMAVLRASKFNGTQLARLTPEGWKEKPNMIQVHHSLRQPVIPNVCGDNNGGCSHLCLPSPQFTGYGLSFPSESANTNSAEIDWMSDETRKRRTAAKKNKESRVRGRRSINTKQQTFEGKPSLEKPYTCSCPDGLELRGSQCYRGDEPVISPNSVMHTSSIMAQHEEDGFIPLSPEDNDEEEGLEHETVHPQGGAVGRDTVLSAGQDQKQEPASSSAWSIVLVVLLSVLCTGSVVTVGFVMLYRHYLKPKHGMDFDNPVYRKTTTESVSTVSIEKSCSSQSLRKHYQYPDVGQAEEGLEPLNAGHVKGSNGGGVDGCDTNSV